MSEQKDSHSLPEAIRIIEKALCFKIDTQEADQAIYSAG
jgi:hypothetical protein